ncbi:MAG TPA: nickel-binding protein [Kiloniellales bacterium]|nr:nickel-binding protein [Kiloniellales bacterium]
MPIFLDRHDLSSMTAADVAEAHRKDLEVEGKYGVRFLTYWFDEKRGSGFCLIDAPDKETAQRVHAEAHGDVAQDIIPVDLSAVEAFLGRITDPPHGATAAPAREDPAFRAVMFTDIVGSTAMVERLGDERGVEMIRAHDSLVRRALGAHGGREVKHTGDGIMAAFAGSDPAISAARDIQRSLDKFNQGSGEALALRIGIHAGEPVEDSNDLFGATVHLAARLCQSADPSSIWVSALVRETLHGEVPLQALGPRTLKGFNQPVEVYAVAWR